LRKEPDVNVEEIDGSRGEFTVLVDDHPVSQKGGGSESLSDVTEVVNAVRRAPSTAGSRR